jgi:hypothetical protein
MKNQARWNMQEMAVAGADLQPALVIKNFNSYL